MTPTLTAVEFIRVVAAVIDPITPLRHLQTHAVVLAAEHSGGRTLELPWEPSKEGKNNISTGVPNTNRINLMEGRINIIKYIRKAQRQWPSNRLFLTGIRMFWNGPAWPCCDNEGILRVHWNFNFTWWLRIIQNACDTQAHSLHSSGFSSELSPQSSSPSHFHASGLHKVLLHWNSSAGQWRPAEENRRKSLLKLFWDT